MKPSIFFASICIGLAGFSVPVNGAQLVPDVFASAFCTAMDSGVNRKEAIRFAVRMSLDRTKPKATKVGDVDLDVRMSIYAAQAQCPQHLGGDWL
jgi:hypothetical protein